MKEWRE